MRLRKTFRFEASHVLPKHPGKCSRLHGHSWVLHVEVEGPVDEKTGFVMDYADISANVKPLIEELDHRHLGTWERFNMNAIPFKWRVDRFPLGFYPTSENLLMWIGERLSFIHFPWSALEIEETCTSSARLTKEESLSVRSPS